MGVYSPSDKGKQAVCEKNPLILLHCAEKSVAQKGLPHKSLPISGEVLPEEKKCDEAIFLIGKV